VVSNWSCSNGDCCVELILVYTGEGLYG